MDINAYLSEIEHAASTVLSAVWSDHREMEALSIQAERLAQEAREGYERAQAFKEYDDPDDIMLGVGIHWETYFGADKEHYHAQESIEQLRDKIATREFSRNSLAGNILQFGKQGISITSGNLASAKPGRLIGSQELKNIIWQARNQALHWEDSDFSKAVQDCFNLLSTEVDNNFSQYRQRNMAFDVIKMLGWTDLDKFKNDMQLFA